MINPSPHDPFSLLCVSYLLLCDGGPPTEEMSTAQAHPLTALQVRSLGGEEGGNAGCLWLGSRRAALRLRSPGRGSVGPRRAGWGSSAPLLAWWTAPSLPRPALRTTHHRGVGFKARFPAPSVSPSLKAQLPSWGLHLSERLSQDNLLLMNSKQLPGDLNYIRKILLPSLHPTCPQDSLTN